MSLLSRRISAFRDSHAISLLEILAEVDGDQYEWRVRWLWATARSNSGLCVLDLEEKINSSRDGIPYSWAELNVLAGQFEQVIDLELIGIDKDDPAHGIMILADDSTEWRIGRGAVRELEEDWLSRDLGRFSIERGQRGDASGPRSVSVVLDRP